MTTTTTDTEQTRPVADAAAKKDRAPRARKGRAPRRPREYGPPKFDLALLDEVGGPALYGTTQAGKVVDVTEQAVFVEVQTPGGPLRVAVTPGEFAPAAEAGQDVDVFLVAPPTAEQPAATGSVQAARKLKALDGFAAAFSQKQAVPGVIEAEVKGGYAVAVGGGDEPLRGFLPKSHGHHPRLHESQSPVGEQDEFVVTEFDAGRANIVLSRKGALKKRYADLVKSTWDNLEVGQKVTGRVRSIVQYGAFVDIGGVDGLLHASDLSWDRTPRVSSVLTVGDTVETQVLSADKESGKLKLGLKQLIPNPWQDIRGKVVAGADVEGDVVALTDYGAFVRLPEGVEGLVHMSEVTWDRIKHVSSRLSIGQRITARVLDVDHDGQRLSLSMRALEKSPYEKVAEKYPAGTVIKAEVKSLTDFGAFIALDDQVDGLIHVGELSWTERVDHPSELLQVGQEVEAVVLDVDVERQRVACSMKQLQENPWGDWEKKYARGSRHKLTAEKVTDKEVVFTLEESALTGVCNFRDLSTEPVSRAQDVVRVGDELELLVKNFDRNRKKVVLSVKALVEGDTREAYKEYKAKEAESGGGRLTLADAIGDQLKDLAEGPDAPPAAAGGDERPTERIDADELQRLRSSMKDQAGLSDDLAAGVAQKIDADEPSSLSAALAGDATAKIDADEPSSLRAALAGDVEAKIDHADGDEDAEDPA